MGGASDDVGTTTLGEDLGIVALDLSVPTGSLHSGAAGLDGGTGRGERDGSAHAVAVDHLDGVAEGDGRLGVWRSLRLSFF